MKIAYFVNHYPKVSHTFIRREILALERLGFTVERYALRGWDGDLVDVQDQSERQRTRYVLQRGPLPLLGAILSAALRAPLKFMRAVGLTLRMGWRADRPPVVHLVYLAEACLLRRWISSAGVEHLHAHFGTNPAEVALLIHALGGPPFSFTVHGPEEFDKPELLKLREKVAHSAFAVTISSFGRSQLLRWIDLVDWHKVHQVHCGLDRSFIEVDVSPAPDVPRLVCVGRLCEQKGQLLLVRAVRKLLDAGIAVELVLAGDGEMRGEIDALIRCLRLESCVRVTGWISGDAVREQILAARALVVPSFAEGLPVVLMEAMALRRPVLSTYVAGIPELVISGANGWLVPAGDEAALVGAMARCLATPSILLAQMGESARERILERHSVDVEAAKLALHFEEAAARTVDRRAERM
jgi:colanic acid/amylovoran biosynthesis glycosyltransferase